MMLDNLSTAAGVAGRIFLTPSHIAIPSLVMATLHQWMPLLFSREYFCAEH